MELDCPSENQAKIKEGQVTASSSRSCISVRVLPQNWGSKGQNPWVVLYGTNWHAAGVSKTWNPGPQIVFVLLHLLPDMWVCLKIRYPSVSSNSPLHEHQIAIFYHILRTPDFQWQNIPICPNCMTLRLFGKFRWVQYISDMCDVQEISAQHVDYVAG